MGNEITPVEAMVSKICWLRGKKVMLDRDLAELYGVKAKRLREQVSRNNDRLPENFMFQLSETELNSMVSQNATPSNMSYFGVFYLCLY